MKKNIIVVVYALAALFNLSAVSQGDIVENYTIKNSGRFNKIVLPNNEKYTIHFTDGKEIQIRVNKVLNFRGHPPKPVTAESLKTYMGVVYKEKFRTLTIATYGEWRSKEGGASVSLELYLPKGLEIERNKGLHGDKSQASLQQTFDEMREMWEKRDNYWYNSAAPAKGWTHLKDIDNVPVFRFLLPIGIALILLFILKRNLQKKIS